MTVRLGVLVSGSGSNLQAIIDAIAAGDLDASIEVVVSSKEGTFGAERAQKAGITAVELTPALYANPQLANERIRDELVAAGVEYVVMAGYMRMLGTEVLDAFPDRVLNLHPALLPSFQGAHAIEDAINAGVKVTGVTVHFANAEYDKGPIIAQEAVSISAEDTIDTLAERIHAVEHQIYPRVLQQIAEGRVSINESRHVHISRYH